MHSSFFVVSIFTAFVFEKNRLVWFIVEDVIGIRGIDALFSLCDCMSIPFVMSFRSELILRWGGWVSVVGFPKVGRVSAFLSSKIVAR